MLIFWVTGPHTGRIVTQWRYCNKVRIEGDKPTLNLYFYGPKYRSSDVLPAPEIFYQLFYSRLFSEGKRL